MIEAAYLISELAKDDTHFTNYPNETKYISDAMAKFEKYKNHRAVKRMAMMISQGFTWHVIPQALLYFNDDFTRIDDIVPDEAILQRAGGLKALEYLGYEALIFSRPGVGSGR